MAAEHQPREKALHELLSHHMVDIYVGSENTHWILHEKLLCAKSKFFNKIFYTKQVKGQFNSGSKTIGFPDEEDEPFRLFVGWLYSTRVPVPKEEKDLGDLFDLYLMGEKWQIASLIKDVLDTVRWWYRTTDTFPGLRRVQYVYANTDDDSPMRHLLVSSVARMLATRPDMPGHWDRALKKNGQLAVDILRAIQAWKVDPESIPDAREEAQKLEKEKVKVAEEAEKKQKGIPKNEIEENERNEEQDAGAAAGKDVESLANGDGKLTNGVSEHDDDETMVNSN
ncbi:hypothetical protein BT63DRAFT_422503 [Microthyrium microscopicum]|uniref:BTB domain-containing protein n=1 Tax=Microthyrium microscopicum TaxID=703497 RepID=A0A6A6UIG3_9PEZI|nr:hypothetical protein BT63DRAFT_422503 [Microthyrium microscopicum]